MEDWRAILVLLDHGLDQLGMVLSDLPDGILVAALVVPIALAAISRRFPALLAALCLAVLAAVIVVRPAYMATTLAIGSYVGSLWVALLALRSSWKDRAIKAELASLRAEVAALSQAEERRLLVELRATKDLTNVGPLAPPPGAP